MTNKDLLKQYVDTGLKLSQHQIESLPPNLFKTYIRKRLIAVEENGETLEEYEFDLMPKEIKNKYFEKRIIASYRDSGLRIKDFEYVEMPLDIKIEYLKKLFNLVISGKYNTVFMSFMGGIYPGYLFGSEYFDVGRYLGKDAKKKYIAYRLKNNARLFIWEFYELDIKQKIKYIDRLERSKDERLIHELQSYIGKEEYYKLAGDRETKKVEKNNRDWDIPKPPEEINQVYESLKRHKQIISYGN